MNITKKHSFSIRLLSIVLISCFAFAVATDSSLWQETLESDKLELSEKQGEDKTETEMEADEFFPFFTLLNSAIVDKNNIILLTYAKAFYAGEMREILTPPPKCA